MQLCELNDRALETFLRTGPQMGSKQPTWPSFGDLCGKTQQCVSSL